jgi:hypothetical protein
MSSARIVVAIAGIVSASIGGFLSTIVFHQIVDAVNQRLPPEQQFGPTGWYLSKNQKLFAQYRQLYPDRTLEVKFWSLVAVAFGSLLGAACAVGFFR